MGNYIARDDRSDGPRSDTAIIKIDPLALIHEDHLREREIIALIDQIAMGSVVDVEVLQEVIGFLTGDLPLHLMDEEEDLFPLLKRRCEPEDDIVKVIAKLQRDHAHAIEDTPKVVALLESSAKTQSSIGVDDADALKAFAKHARRHLILENAIILPFAKLRLTEGDLETLHIRMCQRRGLEY